MRNKSQTMSKDKLKLDIIEYSQGQYIVREGDIGDCAYVLLQGEVNVVKTNLEGRAITIANLGVNEIFGEMCLLEPDNRRSASVLVVSERAKVMLITRDHFQDKLDALPSGVKAIMRILIDRLRRADYRLASIA